MRYDSQPDLSFSRAYPGLYHSPFLYKSLTLGLGLIQCISLSVISLCLGWAGVWECEGRAKRGRRKKREIRVWDGVEGLLLLRERHRGEGEKRKEKKKKRKKKKRGVRVRGRERDSEKEREKRGKEREKEERDEVGHLSHCKWLGENGVIFS
jgi:hypothetical protein